MGKDLSEMTLDELWRLFPIIVRDYNPRYPEWYRQEARALARCAGENALARISHIGSSAVKGLAGKPTVDILLEIRAGCDTDALQQALTGCGWTLMHAQTSPGFRLVFNKGYTPNGLDEKVYHLHVRYSGDWDELYFRDYLQKYPQVADEYGRLKLELAGRCRHDRDGYTNAKADFIRKYTRLATDEFKGRYTPADAKPGE